MSELLDVVATTSEPKSSSATWELTTRASDKKAGDECTEELNTNGELMPTIGTREWEGEETTFDAISSSNNTRFADLFTPCYVAIMFMIFVFMHAFW